MRALPALSLSVLGACATGDFVDRFDDTRDLEARAPAAFAVALAPLDVAADVGDAALGAIGTSSTALRAALRRDLDRLRAASRVAEVGADDLGEADAIGADLLLRPRLSQSRFEYLGGSRDGLLSSLLWITTWVGGLFVADCDYHAGLQIDWQVLNPHNGQVIASLGGTTRSCRLGFLDRNEFASLGTLMSVVVPPVFTVDDPGVLAASLTAAAIAHSAGEVTRYLKDGLAGDERALLGELQLESPRNGASVAPGCRLHGALVAHDLIDELQLYVNGELAHRADAEALPPRARQQVGAGTYRVELPGLPLPLRAGDNEVVIEYVAGGRRSSRTLVLRAAAEVMP